MTAVLRRGYCPSLETPMEAGDGLLMRLTPPVGGWCPSAVAMLAEAAGRHGNGVLEATSRGNFQLRGFRGTTVPAFIQAVTEAGIAEGPRVVAVGPLAGSDALEVADPRPIAATIGAGLPPLAPKVSVVVDGGGALQLDNLAADVRLRAAGDAGWHLFAGAVHLGVVPEASAARAALVLLHRLSALGGFARMRDVVAAEGVEALRTTLPDLAEAPAPESRPAPNPIGVHRLRHGFALGVAGPFGRIGAADLAAFARAVPRHCRLRPAAPRALLAIGLTHTEADALRDVAGRLGLITQPDDRRRRIAACPGAPDCAAAKGPTRPLAEMLAAHPDLPPDGMLHVSGCAKGCAHAAPAALTLVCRDGTFALVRDGTAACEPVWIGTAEDVPAALHRQQP